MGFICDFHGCTNRSVRFGEDECPGHVASEADSEVCGRCGIHIDSLRPPYE